MIRIWHQGPFTSWREFLYRRQTWFILTLANVRSIHCRAPNNLSQAVLSQVASRTKQAQAGLTFDLVFYPIFPQKGLQFFDNIDNLLDGLNVQNPDTDDSNLSSEVTQATAGDNEEPNRLFINGKEYIESTNLARLTRKGRGGKKSSSVWKLGVDAGFKPNQADWSV